MAINPGDFCIALNSSFSSYPTIIKFRSKEYGENCSAKVSHMVILNTHRIYRGLGKIKEINLIDPDFIHILEAQVIREDIQKEFWEFITKKLIAECGELKGKAPAKVSSDLLIKVIESNESLGFIHING
jgi:hypothetical protein